MARALPRYQPFNPRSIDVYGVGAGLLQDNFDPIGLMDERYRRQLQLEEAEQQADDREREREIEASLAEQGGSLEDMLARAEQEYLSQGDFTGAFEIAKKRRSFEPDPIKEAEQLAALYKSAQDVAGVDPAQGLGIINQYRSQMGQQPLEKMPEQLDYTNVPGVGRVAMNRADGSYRVVIPSPDRPERPNYIPLDQAMFAMASIDAIAREKDPQRKAAIMNTLSPENRELINQASGASAIQETGRPRATVQQAQEAMRRRGKPPYTAKQLDKLRAQGLVE